jgi:hypothetical protein
LFEHLKNIVSSRKNLFSLGTIGMRGEMRAIASLGCEYSCEGAMGAIAPSISPHACPRQGHWRPTPNLFEAGNSGINMRHWWSARRQAELVEGTSPRGLTCHCTDKARYIYSIPLHI